MKKVVLIALVLVLAAASVFTASTKPVEASGIIYIRSNGLIEGTDKITSADNTSYTFIDDINGSVVVERSNIVIDGNGYTLHGPGVGLVVGFNLTSVSNVTITNTDIDGFGNSPGILLSQASNNIISRNNITCFYGVSLSSSVNNSIYENNIKVHYMLRPYTVGISLFSSDSNKIHANEIQWSEYGIRFSSSDGNAIFGNTIAGNGYGLSLSSSSNNNIYGNDIGANYNYNIGLWSSSDNTLYHNNVIGLIGPNPTVGLNNSTNTWHDGYPSGGNYWGRGLLTTDVDVKSGPYQNETGSDGIADTLHLIDANNTDNYPLMGMFSDFEATSEHHVQIICNSTISGFNFSGTAISFNVSGANDTTGFCRILIPTALIGTPYKVYVNGTQIDYASFSPSNSRDSYLYFTYKHSTQEVVIMRQVPAFPTFPASTSMFILIVLTAVIVLAAVIVTYRRRRKGV